MDTNMVIPTSHSTCTVVYDYFLEKETLESLGDSKDSFIASSLTASDQVSVVKYQAVIFTDKHEHEGAAGGQHDL